MAYQSKYTGLQIDDILDSVEWKQDEIEDLSSIRAGAQKGATALQSYTEKYTGTVTGIKINGVVKSGNGVIDLGTIESKTLTESDIAAMGFTKNTGTYSKPSGGIPASDLAPDVFLQGERGEKGDKGDTGATGPQGPQGIGVTSVVQTTTSSADSGSNVVTVTLSDGKTSTFTVKNGSKGSNGTNGTNGTNGATFTPSVDSAGNLSWTNNGGLTNPPTVNIKGPKGDSGEGGGSSEDNRYFTEFTVEEFIEGCTEGNIITNSIEEFSNAVNNNKIICIPYNNMGYGFLIASYEKYNSEEGYFSVYLETEEAKYSAYCNEENDYGDPVGLFGDTWVAYVPQIIDVKVSEDGYNYLETYDNIYHIIGEVNYLAILPCMNNSSTVRFATGYDSILEIYDYILWANGNAPVLEPYTSYELSIARGYDGYYGVLVPFKYVE